jgi:putative addiction module killer protein
MDIYTTDVFTRWLSGLRDKVARRSIISRLSRLEFGLAGDVKPVGSGVSELRIDVGAGYRVYYRQRGDVLIVYLCGGDKRTQSSDIIRAIELSKQWKVPDDGC